MTSPRITGGSARGRVLRSPVPASARPTSARVREALFSLVGHDLSGQRVLDAFGGTGLLGLEAWSRGADVVIAERDAAAVKAIRLNVQALDAPVEVLHGDVLALAPGLGPFDGILVDPPYKEEPGPILRVLAPSVRGWLVLELDDARPTPEVPGLALDRRRTYGGSALAVYAAAPG